MKLVWSDRYTMHWGEHVFPVDKYREVRDRLLEEKSFSAADILEPEPALEYQLLLVHPQSFLRRMDEMTANPESGILEFEVPVTREVVDVFRLMCGGTVMAARRALEDGAAGHIGGGFHHAFAERGEGFCLLNDMAIAARVLQREGVVKRVAMVDLDVHQGNGTAGIFRDDPSVYTFSMHQENNYPVKVPSTLDIGLDDGAGDEEYLALLRRALPGILDGFRPDFVIYQAGADPYREDRLGGLALTIDGLLERDTYVVDECARRKIPILGTVGGGYAQREEDVVTIHANTMKTLRRGAR